MRLFTDIKLSVNWRKIGFMGQRHFIFVAFFIVVFENIVSICEFQTLLSELKNHLSVNHKAYFPLYVAYTLEAFCKLKQRSLTRLG